MASPATTCASVLAGQKRKALHDVNVVDDWGAEDLGDFFKEINEGKLPSSTAATLHTTSVARIASSKLQRHHAPAPFPAPTQTCTESLKGKEKEKEKNPVVGREEENLLRAISKKYVRLAPSRPNKKLAVKLVLQKSADASSPATLPDSDSAASASDSAASASDSAASASAASASAASASASTASKIEGKVKARHPPATPNHATTSATASHAPLQTVYTLSKSQLRAREAVASGANCFLTGSAGTGKSQITRAIMQFFSERYADASNPLSCSEGGKVALTATTGIAAVNLGMGARTFFSALKLTPYDIERYSPMELALKIKSAPWAASVIRALRHLILDEASMLSGSTLDLLNDVFCVVRGYPRGADGVTLPFGGVQMILIGDVCQLPPIPKKGTPRGVPKDHVFKAHSFTTGNFQVCVLTETFRQTDPVFVDLLGRVRVGEATPEDVALLNTRVDVDLEVAGIKPTVLYCTNRDVSAENESRLADIEEPVFTYTARHSVHLEGHLQRSSKDAKDKKEAVLHGKACDLAKSTRVGKIGPRRSTDSFDPPSIVTLKVGAQVQLAANMDIESGLANGTKGVVTGFMTPEEWNEHLKDQGQGQASELDETYVHDGTVETDSDKAFTAPSSKSGSGAAADTFLYPHEALPVVRFLVPSADPAKKFEDHEMLVPYWRWTAKEKDLGEAIVAQMPLRLAWATTIHSSQGLTLSLVRINLEGVFEPGQAYVALSRATSMAGMSIVAPVYMGQLFADPECVAFSRGLLALPSTTEKDEDDDEEEDLDAYAAEYDRVEELMR